MNPLSLLTHLGPRKLALFGLYRFGLLTGHYRRSTPAQAALCTPPALPARLPNSGGRFTEADEIASGSVRLFGGDPVPLELTPPGPLAHWTAYETGRARHSGNPDIKFTWEPARFGWVYPLARAYLLTGDDAYAAAFWRHAETFLAGNPANLGPNWVSGQEVALRLIALLFARRAFAASPESTPERIRLLEQAAGQHARRIPLTLPYARAQNNNHLVSEAVGLLSAGLLLPPDHANVKRWREQGWRWLNTALQTQIAPDGTYMQHSANYHRLVLQLATWAAAILPPGLEFPDATLERLQSATRWLLALADSATGRVPNLGANDGAYIMPLTALPFADYRPALQAASFAFLGAPAFPPGAWDEQMQVLSRVTGDAIPPAAPMPVFIPPSLPGVLRTFNERWAYLRAARFTDRPSHADQLHVDLWWRGLNLAHDAGTFQYNALPPWDNALAGTAAHNTVTVDGQDQMTRAGRFLWLDWAQAEVITATADSFTARHDGYRRLGVLHTRTLTALPDGWRIEDQLSASHKAWEGSLHTARLHWLLPDMPWSLDGCHLTLRSEMGDVRIDLTCSGGDDVTPTISLARAGELLAGQGSVPPTRGWASPTYGLKVPALSLALEVTAPLSIVMQTRFTLPATAR